MGGRKEAEFFFNNNNKKKALEETGLPNMGIFKEKNDIFLHGRLE